MSMFSSLFGKKTNNKKDIKKEEKPNMSSKYPNSSWGRKDIKSIFDEDDNKK